MFWYYYLLLSEYFGMVWVMGVLYVALPSFKIALTSLKRVKSCCGRSVREPVLQRQTQVGILLSLALVALGS